MRDQSPEVQAILDRFRDGPCEICGRRLVTDAAHVFSVGAGEVNITENLIGLCRYCHSQAHAGLISRHVLLCVVSVREGTTPDAIQALVWTVRRANAKRKRSRR